VQRFHHLVVGSNSTSPTIVYNSVFGLGSAEDLNGPSAGEEENAICLKQDDCFSVQNPSQPIVLLCVWSSMLLKRKKVKVWES
jgi:hypothetical protein